jgi:transcriptional regulator with XRE-family HTH domain
MKPTSQHMIVVLKTSMRALGFTNREVESRLGVSRGYLTRLFSGVMDLRFDHVAEIAEAIGLEPEELLRLAFPPAQKPASPEIARLREVFGATPASPEPAAPAEVPDTPEGATPFAKELERMIEKTMKKMLFGSSV